VTGLPRALLAGLLALLPVSASAQIAQPSRLAVDSVVALDQTVAEGGSYSTGFIADALASIDLGGNVQFMARPLVRRLANNGTWDAELWMAALRYERPGTVGIRVEGGLIPSPIGVANLMLRPHLNPVIAQPSSLFAPLPTIRGPRATLLGALYPLGISATASTLTWDVRAAVVDSSPLRGRDLFGDDNPPRFANLVAGGGVTPFVGFRIGASIARGGWLKGGESPTVPNDRDATVVTVESEFSYRYTKLVAEWTRDRVDTDAGTRTATGIFIQAQQTLAPRWFLAGRVERVTSPPLGLATSTINQRLTGVEETLGYRLTADLTLRVSHRARKAFAAPGFIQSMAVSAVWWKRLM
jgi:hypothetical protein